MRATALKVEPQAVDSVSDPWTLTVTDMTLVRGKAADGRLAFGMLLLFFRRHGRFPNAASEIDAQQSFPWGPTVSRCCRPARRLDGTTRRRSRCPSGSLNDGAGQAELTMRVRPARSPKEGALRTKAGWRG